ncbi:MAG: MoxR family ATPase [Alphaproteobacteria bacterium]|nr:MoxR family ATPase [Alphaproteobacteria bacterium]MCB9974658.1 MoxR family ATPase [Rhodospirillales bacterium]
MKGEQMQVLQKALESRIIGQKDLIRSMMLCLLCDGHMLIEGMPGLAKTTAAKTLAQALEGEFQRIQFTPDLLPSDLIGTDVYLHESATFEFRQGPLFHNIILADEVNRAPAKVQSALLEAMEERQVSVGLHTYKLAEIYMVLATQNPIEQEGTYTLPEAQLDRFLMHAVAEYPSHEEEMQILELDDHLSDSRIPQKSVKPVMTQKEILAARDRVRRVYTDRKIKHYAVSLVSATRKPGAYSQKLYDWIQHGASPRATLGLVAAARALAWLNGDGYVTPHHVQQVAPNILRHRIIPTFEAEADGVSRQNIIEHLLEVVAVP